MEDSQSLSHTAWECKYPLVWIPKYRRKALYEQLRRYLGDVLRELAMQRESKILEGQIRPDHVHSSISGHGATMSRPWARMRMPSASTSSVRKMKTAGWTNCKCLADRRL